MTPGALKRRLVASAAARYRGAGRYARYFARGKLSTDPVYSAILALGLVPDYARVLDLGCGQGLAGAWLLAAEDSRRLGHWSGAWPEPPRHCHIDGIEREARAATRARCAIGPRGYIEVADIRHARYPQADIALLLDVLHYLEPPAQEAVLAQVRSVLTPGGLLLLRIGDAGAGLAFRCSTWIDRAVVAVRGHGPVRLHCRSARQWIELLARLGFGTDSIPMSGRTPFANVLLVAHAR